MGNLQSKPIAKAAMLIRKPASVVFEAFVNPEMTVKFWFTRSSGRLEAGKQIQWDWEMYGVSIPVTVKNVEADRRIVIEWPGHSGATTVEWILMPRQDGTTFVSITESGFTGKTDELMKQITDSTEGFCLVLAGLKALLEHDVRLNLVSDRFPEGIEQ